MKQPDLEAFIERYFGFIGAVAHNDVPGIVRYEIPPERREGLNASTLRTTFDPALVERYEGVEIITPGSLVLDRILEDATSRGHHCVGRVEASMSPPVGDVLGANIKVKGARSEIVSTRKEQAPYFLFAFKVTLVTDEKTELLEEVLVNSRSRVGHRVKELFLEESLALPEEISPNGDLHGSYKAACEILERHIVDRVEEVIRNAQEKREDEVSRINGYFNGLVREAMESKMPHQLGSVLKALDDEREKRLDEAGAKYDLNSRVRLVSVRTILVPTTVVVVRLVGQEASREMRLEYDEIGLDVSSQKCEGCERETLDISFCGRGHVVCEHCERTCALCGRISCIACEAAGKPLHACAECSRALCDAHAVGDDIGHGEYCPSHILDCPSCSKNASRAFVARCSKCNQKYCFLCVGKRQRLCATCRALSVVRSSDEDVKLVIKKSVAGAKFTKWSKAKNKRFTIVEGRSLLSKKTFVIDRKGNLVWEG